MKNSVIAFLLLFLLGCASTQERQQYVTYKLKSNGKSIKSSYREITRQEARVLLESFEVSNRALAQTASKDREIGIHLYTRCYERCVYVVGVSITCSGLIEYYFEPSGSELKPLFNFIKSDQVLHECCFGPKKSWFRRLLNI